jgi:flagellar basal-body rod protein FlgC
MNAASIALSGMRAAEARLQASANNVANVRSEGAIPPEDGAQPAAEATPVYKPQRVESREAPGGGVSTRIISESSFDRTYRPESTNADTDGMVAEPRVDLAQEAVNQISAAQQYAANIKVMQTATTMSQQMLSIRV